MYRFCIDRDEIVQMLNLVSPAIAVGSTFNPILKSVLIEVVPEGLSVRASNSLVDIRVFSKYSFDVSSAFSFCVDSILVGLLQRMDPGEIRFDLSKKLSISRGEKSYSLPVVDASQFPEFPKIEYDMSVSSSNLIEGFKRAAIGISQASDRPILQAYHLDERGFVIASDGNQVSIFNLDFVGLDANIFAKGIDSVLSLLDRCETIQLGVSSSIGFKGDDWEAAIKLVSGDFPSKAADVVNSLVESSPVLTMSGEKSQLIQILRICDLFSKRAFVEGKAYHTVFSLRNGRAIFSMNCPDLVELQEVLDGFTFSGESEFEIWFQPSLLLEALELVEGLVEIRFFGSLKPFLVFDKDSSDWKYLQVAMARAPSKDEERESKHNDNGEEGDF